MSRTLNCESLFNPRVCWYLLLLLPSHSFTSATPDRCGRSNIRDTFPRPSIRTHSVRPTGEEASRETNRSANRPDTPLVLTRPVDVSFVLPSSFLFLRFFNPPTPAGIVIIIINEAKNIHRHCQPIHADGIQKKFRKSSPRNGKTAEMEKTLKVDFSEIKEITNAALQFLGKLFGPGHVVLWANAFSDQMLQIYNEILLYLTINLVVPRNICLS